MPQLSQSYLACFFPAPEGADFDSIHTIEHRVTDIPLLSSYITPDQGVTTLSSGWYLFCSLDERNIRSLLTTLQALTVDDVLPLSNIEAVRMEKESEEEVLIDPIQEALYYYQDTYIPSVEQDYSHNDILKYMLQHMEYSMLLESGTREVSFAKRERAKTAHPYTDVYTLMSFQGKRYLVFSCHTFDPFVWVCYEILYACVLSYYRDQYVWTGKIYDIAFYKVQNRGASFFLLELPETATETINIAEICTVDRWEEACRKVRRDVAYAIDSIAIDTEVRIGIPFSYQLLILDEGIEKIKFDALF